MYQIAPDVFQVQLTGTKWVAKEGGKHFECKFDVGRRWPPLQTGTYRGKQVMVRFTVAALQQKLSRVTTPLSVPSLEVISKLWRHGGVHVPLAVGSLDGIVYLLVFDYDPDLTPRLLWRQRDSPRQEELTPRAMAVVEKTVKGLANAGLVHPLSLSNVILLHNRPLLTIAFGGETLVHYTTSEEARKQMEMRFTQLCGLTTRPDMGDREVPGEIWWWNVVEETLNGIAKDDSPWLSDVQSPTEDSMNHLMAGLCFTILGRVIKDTNEGRREGFKAAAKVLRRDYELRDILHSDHPCTYEEYQAKMTDKVSESSSRTYPARLEHYAKHPFTKEEFEAMLYVATVLRSDPCLCPEFRKLLERDTDPPTFKDFQAELSGNMKLHEMPEMVLRSNSERRILMHYSRHTFTEEEYQAIFLAAKVFNSSRSYPELPALLEHYADHPFTYKEFQMMLLGRRVMHLERGVMHTLEEYQLSDLDSVPLYPSVQHKGLEWPDISYYLSHTCLFRISYRRSEPLSDWRHEKHQYLVLLVIYETARILLDLHRDEYGYGDVSGATICIGDNGVILRRKLKKDKGRYYPDIDAAGLARVAEEYTLESYRSSSLTYFVQRKTAKAMECLANHVHRGLSNPHSVCHINVVHQVFFYLNIFRENLLILRDRAQSSAAEQMAEEFFRMAEKEDSNRFLAVLGWPRKQKKVQWDASMALRDLVDFLLGEERRLKDEQQVRAVCREVVARGLLPPPDSDTLIAGEEKCLKADRELMQAVASSSLPANVKEDLEKAIDRGDRTATTVRSILAQHSVPPPDDAGPLAAALKSGEEAEKELRGTVQSIVTRDPFGAPPHLTKLYSAPAADPRGPTLTEIFCKEGESKQQAIMVSLRANVESRVRDYLEGKTPPILLHIKYERVSSEGTKITDKVTFPASIAVPCKGQSKQYLPYAAILHKGTDSGGHYVVNVCLSKSNTDTVWVCHNDDEVRLKGYKAIEQEMEQHVYVLMYIDEQYFPSSLFLEEWFVIHIYTKHDVDDYVRQTEGYPGLLHLRQRSPTKTFSKYSVVFDVLRAFRLEETTLWKIAPLRDQTCWETPLDIPYTIDGYRPLDPNVPLYEAWEKESYEKEWKSPAEIRHESYEKEWKSPTKIRHVHALAMEWKEGDVFVKSYSSDFTNWRFRGAVPPSELPVERTTPAPCEHLVCLVRNE